MGTPLPPVIRLIEKFFESLEIFLAVQDSSIGDIRDQCRAVVDTCDLSEIDQKDEKT